MHLDISKAGNYKRVLLRESYREGKSVKKRTISNLSGCDEETISAIQFGLKYYGEFKSNRLFQLDDSNFLHGKSAGAVFALVEVANRIGLTQVLGRDKNGLLALWQIISRILEQGSRLSSVRLHEKYLLAEAIGIDFGFTEDDLYKNLKWLDQNQERIEEELFKLKYKNEKVELLLYDVTSSYLEGEKNDFGAYGYNRDGKKGKKQIVVGLLCDSKGGPVSVQVFSGNTSDTKTFHDQVQKVAEKYRCTNITFVGDRGMIKGPQKGELSNVQFNYITALTKNQILTLEKEETIQLSFFDEELCEAEKNNIRYVLRRNPVRAQEIASNRASKETKIQKMVEQFNKNLAVSKKARAEVAQKNVDQKIAKLKCSWLKIVCNERVLVLEKDIKALEEISRLDGCYVICTDVPKNRLTKDEVHRIYKDLINVERAFRESKTGHLEIRPIHVRRKESTKGHVFVVMCAYSIRRQLETAWHDMNCTIEEGIKSLATISSILITDTKSISIETIPTPTGLNENLLKNLKYTLPTTVVRKKVKVVTRKKLQNSRK